MDQKWNDRYKDQEFAYGKVPNVFFREWLSKFKPGAILMPADGEGRNGVFAARLGWKVTSFDLSTEGRTKALLLAQEHGVAIDYIVGDFEQINFEKGAFDAIGLVYAHFSAEMKPIFHKKLDTYLKSGGLIVLEAFSKKQIDFKKQNPKVGGPDDVDMLYSTAEIITDFDNYEVLVLEEKEIVLEEGKYHNGVGSVIRFVGRKK
jgi:hypothetical protein